MERLSPEVTEAEIRDFTIAVSERAYPKLIHFNEVAEGGHFAAWEQPQTLSEELRATFRSLR